MFLQFVKMKKTKHNPVEKYLTFKSISKCLQSHLISQESVPSTEMLNFKSSFRSIL